MHTAATSVYASSDVFAALLLSTLAGLSTAIGGTAVLFVEKPSATLVAGGLGMACFAMFAVSILDLFATAVVELGFLFALCCLLLGMATFYVLNAVLSERIIALPAEGLWHAAPSEDETDGRRTMDRVRPGSAADKKRLWRVAVVSFVTLTLHNFPEGCAVAVSSMNSGQMGIRMAIAIAMHNLPEGVCIAIPAWASGSLTRWQAVGMTFLSGLSEPIGALLTSTILNERVTQEFLHCSLSFVAGMMIYVAAFELWPEAMLQERPLALACGAGVGAFVMILSLTLLPG